jgi:hypothetical protein
VKNEIGVLVLRDFAGLDEMTFEENALPRLFGGGLTMWGCEQGNQVPVAHDRDSSGRAQVLRFGLVLQGVISPQELHIGPTDILPY